MMSFTQGRQIFHPSWLTSVGLNQFLQQGSSWTCSGEVQGRFGFYLGWGAEVQAVRAGMTPQQLLDHLWLSNILFLVSGLAVACEQQGCAQRGWSPAPVAVSLWMWFSCSDQLQRSHQHPLRDSWYTTTLDLLMGIPCGDSGRRIHQPTLRFLPSSLIPIRTKFSSCVILS